VRARAGQAGVSAGTAPYRGQWYGDVDLGAEFTSAMTITEAHLTLGAGLIADFNPLHVDETFAHESRYGSRILHGVLTSAILGGPVGMYFAGTAIGYLEHNTRFLAPVHAGDTLTLRWRVTAKEDKPRHGGGIVTLRGEAENQHGVVVARAEGRMLVASSPPCRPADA
jgi:acyl dehydratase